MIYNIPSIVKWAGGKKQLLGQFEKLFPPKFKNYYEPFVGGGAVAFYIIKRFKPQKVTISDINEELINTFKVVRDNVDNLKKYEKLHSKKFYYKIRAINPKTLNIIDRATRFIYLNRTCYNGLYRVNSKGEFNVPIGNYKNPKICQEKDLREASNLLKGVEIKATQFYDGIKGAGKNDFVYFDPPYYPISKTSSFTSYDKNDFLEKEQIKLAKVFEDLDKKKCYVMLSNSDTDFIKNLYKKYKITKVNASRMINSVAKKRGKISEIVVTNYNPTQ